MKRISKSILTIILATLLVASFVLTSFATAGSSESKYLDVEQFKGKKIGVVTGTIYPEILREHIENPEIAYYKSNADLLAALNAGKIDALANDEPVVRYLISNTGGCSYKLLKTGKDYLAFASAKDAKGQKLNKEISEFVVSLKESGELDELQKKWFDSSESDMVMEDYSNYPAINGELVIATDPTFPPMEYVDGNQIVGYDIEVIVKFCKEKGYKPVIKNVEFAGIIAGLSAGKYDIAASGVSITEERKKEVLFTEPVYISYGAVGYKDGSANVVLSLSKLKDTFTRTFIYGDRWKVFVTGIGATLLITIASIILGSLLGFVMHVFCRTGNKVANSISRLVNWLIKGLPEVVLLMILFYIVFGNSSVSSELVAIIAFTLTFACSMHSMLVAGEQALDIGQYRAATALGYSDTKGFFRIIFPQTARLIVPSYLSEISAHIKATAIVGYIAVVDVTKAGDVIRGSTYDAFFPLLAVAVIYFVLAAALCSVIKIIARELDHKRRSEKRILKGAVLR